MYSGGHVDRRLGQFICVVKALPGQSSALSFQLSSSSRRPGRLHSPAAEFPMWTNRRDLRFCSLIAKFDLLSLVVRLTSGQANPHFDAKALPGQPRDQILSTEFRSEPSTFDFLDVVLERSCLVYAHFPSAEGLPGEDTRIVRAWSTLMRPLRHE